MNDQRLIVVAGATGHQGGAVVRNLLRAGGWKIRGLTRDPEQPAARELSKQGVEMVRADMNDSHSLHAALQGAYGLFSVQNFWEVGYDAEVRQGKNMADAAEAARVKHLVYNSVGSADRSTGLAHFDSKFEIEKHIRMLGLRHTIFRPVFFMDNLLSQENRELILGGTLAFGLPPETSLQMIALDDIGAFVAMAFAHPDQFEGKAIDIAGDELTMPEAARHFHDALGYPVQYQQIPLEQIRQGNAEWAKMLEWFIREGYQADIPTLRRLHSGLMDFPTWVRAVGWPQMASRRAA